MLATSPTKCAENVLGKIKAARFRQGPYRSRLDVTKSPGQLRGRHDVEVTRTIVSFATVTTRGVDQRKCGLQVLICLNVPVTKPYTSSSIEPSKADSARIRFSSAWNASNDA